MGASACPVAVPGVLPQRFRNFYLLFSILWPSSSSFYLPPCPGSRMFVYYRYNFTPTSIHQIKLAYPSRNQRWSSHRSDAYPLTLTCNILKTAEQRVIRVTLKESIPYKLTAKHINIFTGTIIMAFFNQYLAGCGCYWTFRFRLHSWKFYFQFPAVE